MKKKIVSFVAFLLLIALIVPSMMPLSAAGGSTDEQNQTESVNGQEAETILVRILYVFDDNAETVAAQAYQAYVPVGYKEVLAIDSPKIKGYEPDKSIVILDFKTFTKNTDIVVTYKPIQSIYQVEHKIENVAKNGYSLKDTEKLVGEVNSLVQASPKDYPGFTPLEPFQSERIPAEGQLKLEVKYERNTYRLSYNTDGGSYVPSERRVFGEELMLPNEPVKKGYKFAGWGPELPPTMPAEDLELKAQWVEEDETPFKYAYFLQNADDDNYTILGYVDGVAKTDSPVVLPLRGAGLENLSLFPLKNDAYAAYNIPLLVQSEKDFNKYFIFDEAKTRVANTGKKIDGDGKTIVPLYFNRQVYTIIFGNNSSHYNDPKEFFPELSIEGKTYTKENPYKIQVRFGEDFSDRMPSGADITNIPEGKSYYRPMYVKGTGYGSWMQGKPPYRFNAHMAYCAPETVVDLSQDPNFPYVQYISLELQNSKHQLEVYEHFQEIDGSYKSLTEPTRIEKLDNAWYYTPSNYLGFGPDEDKIDHYRIKNTDTDTYQDPGRSFLIRRDGKPSLKVGDQILNPDGSLKETVTEAYNENTDGVVHVYYGRLSYPIYFYIDPDKQEESLKKRVLYKDRINKALPSLDVIDQYKPKKLTKEYKFDGWYKDLLYQEALTEEELMSADPLTLFAKWSPEYGDIKVTVKPENGNKDITYTYQHGDQIGWNILGTPVKPGYQFTGWYLEAKDGSAKQLYDFSAQLTEDITLVAKYKQNKTSSVTVQFVDEEGTALAAPQTHDQLRVGLDYTYKAVVIDKMLPDTSSKKITVDADPNKNVLTFTYKPFTRVNYKVRYVSRSLDSDGAVVETEIAQPDQMTTERSIDTRSA